MDINIPDKYTATNLTEFNKPLVVGDLPIPQVGNDEVLIKVYAAPINPSDVLFTQGIYPAQKQLPVPAGFEGSGIIVKTGANVPQQVTVGTRVAFFVGLTTGTYSQYALADWRILLKLQDDVSFEDAASAFVNPLTVVGMLHTTKQNGVQAVIHNAAASALGRQFSRYFKDHGIKVINIVRRQQQVDLLISEGAEIVLNETSENFLQELKELSAKLNATYLFEPVAGETTGRLLDQLPNGSTAFVYGFLGGNYVNNISVGTLAFQNKTITGFWLLPWLNKNPILQKEEFQIELNQLLKGSLKTQYAKEFGLEGINEAIEFYQKNQTLGKVLIRPNKQ